MTGPLRFPRPSRKRSEDFARILDAAGSGHAASLGTTDPALAPLVGLAEALRSLPLGPNPDFRAGLRQRLVAVAGIQFAGEAAGTVVLPGRSTAAPSLEPIRERVAAWAASWQGQRRLQMATAGVAAIALVGGVGLAGSRSLPGDPFYGVKRATERAQLALTFGTEAKGERHLQFARTRLHEVQAMVGASDALRGGTVTPLAVHGASSVTILAGGTAAFGGSLTSRVVSTLRDMDAETQAGTADLTSAYNASKDPHPLAVLNTFLGQQYAGMTAISSALPQGAVPTAKNSFKLIVSISKQTDTLLGIKTCDKTCAARRASGDGQGKPGSPATGPCTCTSAPGTVGAPGSQPSGPTPEPTLTPAATPTSGQGSTGDGTGATPSPTPSTLEDQIGGIVSNLPVPVTTPPLPLPDLSPVPLPIPLPTIQLP